jgi:glycerophosphoryl diester phosphodiesterase
MSKRRKILTVAHRGASGEYPENTLLSFRKAIELKSDWIECDIQQAHNNLFVLHDPTLERIAGIPKTLDQLSTETLAAIDVGCGEHIPTLDQVTQLVKGRAGLNIELKGFFQVSSLAQKLQILLDDGWGEDTLLISSFNHPLLADLKLLVPTLPVAPIFYGFPLSGVETAVKLQATTVCMDKKLVSEERIHELKKNGIHSFVFTLNSREEIEKAISIGVSGIITNFPTRVPPT